MIALYENEGRRVRRVRQADGHRRHRLPDPGPTQVEVKLFASGICHSQLHQLGRPNSPVPMVLGHEATGVVTRVGRDVTYVHEAITS